jgi:hypothetical protein
MISVLRYAVCVLVTFLAAACALSIAMKAALNSFGWSPVNGQMYLAHSATQIFMWYLLPIALYLTVCVVGWRYRKEPIHHD